MDIDVKNGGFSIVEIIISLLLVSIALISIATVFPRMTQSKMVMREVEEAHIIANRELKRLYELSRTNTFNHGNTGNFDSVTINNITYTPSYVIEENGYIKSAVMTVQWNKMGNDHSITLTGVIR